jgi:hypothetical protein
LDLPRLSDQVNGELTERYAALEHASDRGFRSGGAYGQATVDADAADAEVEAAMAHATEAARVKSLDRGGGRDDEVTRRQPWTAAAGAVEEQVKRTSGTL